MELNVIKTHPILSRLSIVFLVPLLIVGVLTWRYLDASLPKQEGVIGVTGIQNDISITRDTDGVPYIVAKTDSDALFAIGYLHGQDRLWQLEMQRRISSGRVSEILGEDSLMLDQFMRTLGFYDSARKSLPSLSKDAKESLDAYVKGVNAAINDAKELPAEYKILGFEPEPWTELDSLVTLNLLALNLCGNWREEINRLMLTEEFDKNAADQLMPNYPEDGINTISSAISADAIVLSSLNSLFLSIEQELKLGSRGVGSNAWAISGKHTSSGLPMLANDPHLGTQIPSNFYVANIKGGVLHVAGGTLPGLPFVISGHNEHISWGTTNMMADTQDLYKEIINGDNPDYYQFNDEMVPMTVRVEEIKVKAKFPKFLRDPLEPVKWKVRATHRGPVISDVTGHLSQPVSLQWTALMEQNKTYESFRYFNYATDWNSFQAAFDDYVAPALNMVYADVAGNIGYLGVGKIPLRSKGNGSYPVPGWTEDYQWTGFIPAREMPRILNPESGFVINANNRVIGHDFPYNLGIDWQPPYRAERIDQLLNAVIHEGRKFDYKEIARIQGDQRSLIAEELVPYFIKVQPENSKQERVITLLRNWDHVASLESIGATIFYSWLRNFTHVLLRDDYRGTALYPERSQYLFNSINNTRIEFVRGVLTGNGSAWCDQKHTPALETCDDILKISLAESIKELEKLIGSDIDSWEWQYAHSAKYGHFPFRDTNILKNIFNRKIPSGGGTQTVNIGDFRYSISDGYEQVLGAAYRMIIDLGNLSDMQYILSTGQSANVFSEHYDDMVQRHRDMLFNNLKFNDENLSGKTLTLKPLKIMEQ